MSESKQLSSFIQNNNDGTIEMSILKDACNNLTIVQKSSYHNYPSCENKLHIQSNISYEMLTKMIECLEEARKQL